MSLTPALHQESSDLQPGQILLGVVVDNNDPLKKQRVRVSVPGKLEYESLDELPWLLPKTYSPYGVGDNYGVVHVPRIGSRVYVSFQDADTKFGVYEADAVAQGFVPVPELLANYPNRIGSINPVGDLFYLDLTTKDLFIRRLSGTTILIEESGDVTLTVAGDVTESIKGNVTRIIEGSLHETVKGSVVRQVSGDITETFGGSGNRTYGGVVYELSSGQRTTSCAAHLHSGKFTNNADVVAGGVSVIGHTHGGVDTGSGSTAPPN